MIHHASTPSSSGGAGSGQDKRSSSSTPSMSMSLAPLNRAELTLTIPQPGAHLGMGGGVSMMDMSPAAAGSYQLPSPSFNNFMLTLSPLMQLSSPQATMSPRGHEDACGLGGNCAPVPAVPSAITPMVNTADEIPFAFQATDAGPPSFSANPLPMAPPTAPPTTSRFHNAAGGAAGGGGGGGGHPGSGTTAGAAPATGSMPAPALAAVASLHHVPHHHHQPAVTGAVGAGDGGAETGVLAERFHLMQMDAAPGLGGVGVPGGKEHHHHHHDVVVVPEDPTAAAAATAAVAATRAFAGEIAELPPASPRPGFEQQQHQQHHHRLHHVGAVTPGVGMRRGPVEGEGEEEGGYYSSSSSSDGTNGHAMGGTPLDGEEEYSSSYRYASQHLQPQHVSLPQQMMPPPSQQQQQQQQGGFPVPPPPGAAARRTSSGSVSSVGSGSTASGGSSSSSSGSSARKSGSSSSRRPSGGSGAARAGAAGGVAVAASAQRALAGVPSAAVGTKKCNCRKSKCLKLYCECFAAGAYCQADCGCVDCLNTKASEGRRAEAIQSILSRNPNAFAEKIQIIAPPTFGARGGRGVGAAAGGARGGEAGGMMMVGGDETMLVGGAQGPASLPAATAAHVRGCNCRKSLCIKKYCECFFAGVYCGENCQCEGCQNTSEFAGAHAARAAARKKGKSSGSAAPGRGPSPVPLPPAAAALAPGAGLEDGKMPPPPASLMPV